MTKLQRNSKGEHIYAMQLEEKVSHQSHRSIKDQSIQLSKIYFFAHQTILQWCNYKPQITRNRSFCYGITCVSEKLHILQNYVPKITK